MPQELSRGDQAVEQFTTSDDGKVVVMNVSTPTMIDELFVLNQDGSQRQITNLNGPLFSELNLTAPEEIWYTSFDGKKIQAWIQKPADFDPHKKYPLILNIHGGPHSAYGWVFDHEFQWMAAKGYVVLYPNPRGSTSYGQDFGNIIQYKYPGDDYKDLMIGVDEMMKRGYIDREQARRNRRQRRRTADRLDRRPHASLPRRRLRSAISPTGRHGGTPQTSLCSSRTGSKRHPSTISRTTSIARPSLTSRTSTRP